MATVPLRDRLSFLSRLPTLIKSTSDDEIPCPGYLFEEIAKISHDSAGSSHCLLEYLLNRLQNNSCHVKLKVLKILLYMCTYGSSHFLLQLKRNSSLIQEATVFSGPPDPLHGNSLYQKVRMTAQDLASTLFSDVLLPQPDTQPPKELPSTGMGSRPSPHSCLQGFGFERTSSEDDNWDLAAREYRSVDEILSCDRKTPKVLPEGSMVVLLLKLASTSKVLLATIQKAAEVVASAMLPGHELASSQGRELKEDAYEPVIAPSPSKNCVVPMMLPPIVAQNMRVNHQPGQAGGGWEELDSGQSSQNSLQENNEQSRMSDSYSKSSSDNHSYALEPGNVAERMEAENLGDCLQEVSLVSSLTQGSKVFLTREETQYFLKECGRLNCEVVLAMLNRTLKDPSECVRMRAMCAIYSLMCSDLFSHDQIFAITQQHLQDLSQACPGPVANKATKAYITRLVELPVVQILRHFEALCRRHPTFKNSPPAVNLVVPTRTLAKHPNDLLTDTMLFAGETVLEPTSLAPLPSEAPNGLASVMRLSEGLMTESECWNQLDDLPPTLHQELEECRLQGPKPQEDRPPRGDPDGTVSLFAGMELVAPSSMMLADAAELECISPASRTASCTGNTRDSEDSQEPSAFPFLNV